MDEKYTTKNVKALVRLQIRSKRLRSRTVVSRAHDTAEMRTQLFEVMFIC